MSDEHGWPFENLEEKRLRPWFFSATGYLFALFPDPEEAGRARDGLLANGVPPAEMRLYTSHEILEIESMRAAARSPVAKAIAAVTADPDAKQRYFGTARRGGAALWLFAPTEAGANRLLRLLADHDYSFVRYYGGDGVVDIRRDVD